MLEKVARAVHRGSVAPLTILGFAACFLGSGARSPAPAQAAVQVSAPVEVKQPAPKLAKPSIPKDQAGLKVYRLARRAHGTKILVSTEDRWLWLVRGRDTLMSAPAAVGMGKDFSYDGKKWHFATPRGRRTVLSKKTDPIWTVPDWHYYEVAADEDLEMVRMVPGKKYTLSDGSYLEIRGDDVGRVNKFGNFWAIDPGLEIIFDGKIFIPPITSAQRRVPDALGPYALVLGDGYMIHGVHIYDKNSIGQAVSHGCVRVDNENLTYLYSKVPVGTPVYIF